MKKKIFVLLLAVSLLFTASMPAFAQEKTTASKGASEVGSGIMQPQWINTDVVTAELSFSGDCADCAAIVYGKSGTTKITATAVLSRVTSSGTYAVKTWMNLSTTGDTFYFDKQYYVSSGYTYEFTINAWVYRNGTVEYVTETVYDYCG